MQNTLNSIPEKFRIQTNGYIQAKLAESIDFTLQAKHAHWNVKGPNFIALHQLFDQIAEQSEEYSDLIAERIAQLGGVAQGTLQSVFKLSTLPEYPLKYAAGRDHVLPLSHALARFGESMRTAIELAVEMSDAVTADIFTEISRGVDKNLWLVESHLLTDH